jgi:SAM-dependent methyltransferase
MMAASDTTEGRIGSIGAAGRSSCPVCDGVLAATRHDWILRCIDCGFLRSTLVASAGQGALVIDEARRAGGLEALRRRNFERLLDRLCALAEPRGARLLEIGCAHGWFLEAAARRGFAVMGLEPDAAVAARAVAAGYQVSTGFFPDDVPEGDGFDILVFNDVFEHLAAPVEAAEACRRLLHPGGLLVLNLPSSRGVFYRAAVRLDALGIHGPLERLWQKGFAFPHLSYFEPPQLARLMTRHGFEECHRSALPSVSLDGLWARLRYDRSSRFAGAALVWLGVVAGAPVLSWLPGDIALQIFRRMRLP